MCLGVPGQVIEIHEPAPLMREGLISFGRVQKKINLSFLPEAKEGDYVLVHVGFAMAIIDEDKARETLAQLDSLEQPL